ncbi:hypothetical protein F5884DRAFT_834804 [Xylogone sp. PMI_703]|nr:hypothetical protein F5884DRAFT_834804 [Xylogone sp. PMI_703]
MGHAEESSIPFLEDDAEKHSEPSETIVNEVSFSKRKRVLHYRWLIFCILIVVLTNVVTFAVTGRIRNNRLDMICGLHTSQARTIILDDTDISYSSVVFNGTFLKDTIYRQPASPEVDAAWKALGVDYKPIIVPYEKGVASGIEENHLIIPEQYGGPGYPAVVEFSHQLHCLNLMRQALYWNSEYYFKLGEGPWRNNEPSLRSHVGHCMDSLRQTLMCNADIGLLPFLWVKPKGESPHPFTDFFRPHKCRNFDDIRASAEKRQATWDETMDITPRKGALILDDYP